MHASPSHWIRPSSCASSSVSLRRPEPTPSRAENAMDSIRVLYVEDNLADQDRTHRHLARHAPHIKLTVAGTVVEALERVTVGDMDVLLAGYRLPDGTALDLLD